MDTNEYLKNVEKILLEERKLEEYFLKSEPDKSEYERTPFKSHIDEMYLALQNHKRAKLKEIVLPSAIEKICVGGVIIEKGRTKADL